MKSSSIPFEKRPTYDELINSVNEGFSQFKKQLPKVALEIYGQGGKEPFVKGQSEDEWCWINIFDYPGSQESNNDCQFTCAIESRGDDLFSAITTYALGKKFGKVICDDAGYLAAGREFTIHEFESELKKKLLLLN